MQEPGDQAIECIDFGTFWVFGDASEWKKLLFEPLFLKTARICLQTGIGRTLDLSETEVEENLLLQYSGFLFLQDENVSCTMALHE